MGGLEEVIGLGSGGAVWNRMAVTREGGGDGRGREEERVESRERRKNRDLLG